MQDPDGLVPANVKSQNVGWIYSHEKMPEENIFMDAKTWEKGSQPQLEGEMTRKFKKSFTETVLGSINNLETQQQSTGLTYQTVKGAGYSKMKFLVLLKPILWDPTSNQLMVQAVYSTQQEISVQVVHLLQLLPLQRILSFC